jgi:hypothetical protein
MKNKLDGFEAVKKNPLSPLEWMIRALAESKFPLPPIIIPIHAPYPI